MIRYVTMLIDLSDDQVDMIVPSGTVQVEIYNPSSNGQIETDAGIVRVSDNAPGTAVLRADDGTEYEIVNGKLMKRLPFASGWVPADVKCTHFRETKN